MTNFKHGKYFNQISNKLQKGDYVEFKWHGNKDNLFKGKIEVDEFNEKFFVPIHCYNKNGNLNEKDILMKYYNPMSRFFFFNYFIKNNEDLINN